MRPIDADALVEELNQLNTYTYTKEINGGKLTFQVYGIGDVGRLITKMPTVEDVVQVVRCKDCEYGEDTGEDTGNDYLCHFNGSDWNGGEHFCSYGKRRGE